MVFIGNQCFILKNGINNRLDEEIAVIKKLAKVHKIVYLRHERNRSLERGISQEEARTAVLSGYIYLYDLDCTRFSAVSNVNGKYVRVGVELRDNYIMFSTVIELDANSWDVQQYKRWLKSKRA